ncbi:unnamed protein product [Trichogramma brassicae]|uniref:Endonuclease/exonuclease/phosphatase domain-containing protein n=1 Tax=Trichogramma brassicae TaxID=86971 RepID=A0A6H5IHB3_9HYME|nr:unnamed protein product [Trichogramma brassicae]
MGGLACFYNKDIFKIEKLYIILRVRNLNTTIASVYVDINLFDELLESLLAHISQVEARYPSDRLIIGGDFNSRVSLGNNGLDPGIFEGSLMNEERMSCDEKMDTRGRKLLEIMEEKGFVLINGRTNSDRTGRLTHISTLGNSVIDLVWGSSGSINLISDLEVLQTHTMSDHFPCALTLSHSTEIISAPTHATTRKIKWMPGNRDIYFGDLKYSASVCSITDDVSEMNEILLSSIKKSARIAKMERKSTTNYNRDPPDIQNYKRNLQSHLRACKEASFSAESLEIYQAARKNYRNTCKRKRKAIMDEKIKNISQAKKPENFWKAVKALQYKPYDMNGINLNEWEEYYRGILPQRPTALFQPAGKYVPQLDDDINYQEIEKSLKKCKAHKTPGEDGIPYEFFQNLPQN